MIKVTIVSNNPRVTDIVAETKTVRQILEEHNVTYTNAAISMDGFTLKLGDLDKSLAQLGITEKTTISALANKDNAAQAIIVGSSCVIKSSLTPEEIKQLKKLHPEALVMDNEEGDPVFAIDIDENSPGSINSVGACFGKATSVDGKATITTVMDPTQENPVDFVYEKLGAALSYLNEMEEQLAELIPQLAEEEAKVRGMIVKM
jgi:hypothetical protein